MEKKAEVSVELTVLGRVAVCGMKCFYSFVQLVDRLYMCVCCTSKEACMYSCVSTHGLETLALLISAEFSLTSLCDMFIWRFPQWELRVPSLSISLNTLSSSSMSTQLHSVPSDPSAAPNTRYSPSTFFPKWGHVANLHMDHRLHMPPPIALPPFPFLSPAFFLSLIFSSIVLYCALTLISDRILFILLSLCFQD